MTHYEKRLEEDISTIRSRIERVATQVEAALNTAVRSTIMEDHRLASDVILGDKPINREIRAIDKLCHVFVARHLPSAGHLRLVSSVLRLNVEIERIGDYAVSIAREAVQLSTAPSGSVASDIQLIADQAIRMFRQAMESFNHQKAELATETKAMASQVETTYQRVFDGLVGEGEQGNRPMKDLFALLGIFNRLGRVADQAKNICEDTLFAVAGETKGEKVYRVLFVDERDDGLTQLAVAYARKAFPASGEYRSAGWAISDKLLPALEVYLNARGLDGDHLHPHPLDSTVAELANYHVIVGLGQGTATQLEAIPFHTVFLDWGLTSVPTDLDPERTSAWLDQSSMELKQGIRDLMEALRGEEAP